MDITKRLNYILIAPENFSENFFTETEEGFFFHRNAHPPSPIFSGKIMGEMDYEVDYKIIRLYADYISYLHEIPTDIGENKKNNNPPFEPIFPYEYYMNDYMSAIRDIYNVIHQLKINGNVIWRIKEDEILKIPENILNKKTELELYSMALKQTDLFAEFLFYYRVIERVSQNNGKNWIKNNIDKIKDYPFGKIEIHDDNEIKNLLESYREKALEQLKNLDMENIEIDKYLYENLRCGIAHGKKDDVKREYDAKSINKILNDLYIMKLLARIAIESEF